MNPPIDDIRVKLLLADAAQVHQGKLSALGLGVSAIFLPPQQNPQSAAVVPLNLCGTVTLPFTESNKRHKLSVDLVDLDNKPFLVATPMGTAPFKIEAQFQAAPISQVAHGTDIVVPVAFAFVLPLGGAGKYRFRMFLDGRELREAGLSLDILPAT